MLNRKFLILLLFFFLTRNEKSCGDIKEKYDMYLPRIANISYHSYGGFTLNRNYDETVSNIGFLLALSNDTNTILPFLKLPKSLFLYFTTFYKLTKTSFEKGKRDRAFFFLGSSIFNLLSILIPKSYFLLYKYKRYKILARVSIETGFYISDLTKYIGKKVITLNDLNEGKEENEQKIPEPIYNEIVECAICLKMLKKEENIIAFEECPRHNEESQTKVYHYFHSECIRGWFFHGQKCPTCNAQIDIERYMDVDEDKASDQNKASKIIREAPSLRSFYSMNSFFLSAVYTDITVCLDNYEHICSNENKDKLYYSFEVILLRMGSQMISPSLNSYFYPFIGFCGFSVTLKGYITFSLVPTFFLRDPVKIYSKKFMLDIQLIINLYNFLLSLFPKRNVLS